MILHTINKTPAQSSAFANCLRVVSTDDAILLIEDGVYALLSNELTSTVVTKIYALTEDVTARGLLDKTPAQLSLVDYDGFVELTEQVTAIQSWY